MREFQKLLQQDCLRDEPPFCASACPFNLDIRDFISKTQRGSFSTAFRLYQNTVGFPEIVAQICPAYCQNVCIRQERDESIALKKLEQASIAYTKNKRPNRYHLPKKRQKVAIIGAGLAGLGCALRLTARKYEVVIYEKTGQIGGGLKDLMTEEEYLPLIEEQFIHDKYQLYLNQRIETLDELEADAIFIATGQSGDHFGFENREGATEKKGVFFFGGQHPVEKLASGLSMAAAIEGYLKSDVMRDPVKPEPTRLKMDPESFPIQEPQINLTENAILTQEEAIAEAKRCLKCQCDACLRHCDLMKFYGKAPKRIEEEVEITIHPGTLDGDGTVATRLIATCNHCDVCKIVCPQGIDTGLFLLQSHRAMEEKGAMPWVFHEFWLRDMEFSNSEDAKIYSLAPGSTKANFMYVPGCRLGGSNPEYVKASYDYLLKEEKDTSLLLSCCGAPALWAGDIPLFDSVLADIKEAWQSFGQPQAIFACSTCQRIFKDHLPEIEGLSLYEFMDAKNFEPAGQVKEQLCVFDPCQAAGHAEMQKAVRNLAAKTGLIMEEKDDVIKCCGWGGQVQIANPRYFDGVVKSRSADSDLGFLTYCANCRDVFNADNKEAHHLLDLLFNLNIDEENKLKRRKTPGPALNRLHRRTLKRDLLEQFFGERWEMKKRNLKLYISDQLKKKLDKEMILPEDLEEVITQAENSGAKVVHSDGAFSAYLIIGQMTYWVKYRIKDDGFLLENAYCHRMSIGD
ncbi:MAG: NAD(P)-binding protein [Firmicutes bacterium]|jgi:Fe-S oxidoreductase|nr:NAD(P)-binding protein [Bacillota bacterium]